jgi:hypothetical protein
MQSGGRSLLFLVPSEEHGMLRLLKEANVPIKKLTINPDKTTSVRLLTTHRPKIVPFLDTALSVQALRRLLIVLLSAEAQL